MRRSDKSGGKTSHQDQALPTGAMVLYCSQGVVEAAVEGNL